MNSQVSIYLKFKTASAFAISPTTADYAIKIYYDANA